MRAALEKLCKDAGGGEAVYEYLEIRIRVFLHQAQLAVNALSRRTLQEKSLLTSGVRSRRLARVRKDENNWAAVSMSLKLSRFVWRSRRRCSCISECR